jgi:SAM-dependent methyltransferase
MVDQNCLSPDQRLDALREIHSSTHRLAASSTLVDQVDAFLSQKFGISEPSDSDVFQARLRSLPRPKVRRFLKLLEERSLAARSGNVGSALDVEFFDAIAEDPLSGWVHSSKRAYILDVTVALDCLTAALNIQGPALDLGCHAGYHSLWLATHRRMCVTGLDRSSRAVAYARKKAVQLAAPAATFIRAEWPDSASMEPFELVYSIDGPKILETGAARLSGFVDTQLLVGAVLVLVGQGLQLDVADTLARAASAGLTCGMADVVGGWLGDRFEGDTLLVFIKGATSPGLSENEVRTWDDPWNKGGFAAFANAAAVRWREKTQAFHRSRLGEA